MGSGSLKKRILMLLGAPEAEASDMPRVTLEGRSTLLIEHQKGIVQFLPDCLSVRTAEGTLTVRGRDLCVRVMNREGMLVEGEIAAVEFL